MPKSREIVPFANAKPLVPGAKGVRPNHWRLRREIQTLEADIKEYGKVLARLSEELIDSKYPVLSNEGLE